MRQPEKMGKQNFGTYITQKRKSAGLTQEELAAKLYVTNTTVSKWERGLSYPDITLVTDICRELSISEHEFFTACDDLAAGREKKDATAYRKLRRGWQNFFLTCYLTALIICFICNLAVFHMLSWFWIVLTSLLLAFSFTNVPLIVQKEKGVACLSAATVSLFLLLFSCWIYSKGLWLGFGIAVTAVCLALPWGMYLFWRFCPRRRWLPAAMMGSITVWTFLLVLLCVGVQGGNLLQAFRFTALSYLPVWGIFAIAVYVPLHRCLKAGFICLIADFAIPFFNVGFDRLLGEQPRLTLQAYWDWSDLSRFFQFQAENIRMNVYLFAFGLLAALLVTAIGMILQIRRWHRHS